MCFYNSLLKRKFPLNFGVLGVAAIEKWEKIEWSVVEIISDSEIPWTWRIDSVKSFSCWSNTMDVLKEDAWMMEILEVGC